MPLDPARLSDAVAVLAEPITRPALERPPVLDVPAAVRDRTDAVVDIPLAERLRPGTLAQPVSINAEELTKLLRAAMTAPADPAAGRTRNRIVWTSSGAEALVLLDAVRAELSEGAVGVAVPLVTEQTGEVELPVAFAVGTAAAEAGLLVATPERPPGPTALVVPFGEAAIAAAWAGLLEVAIALAARAGTDRRGDPLVPGALRATVDAFTVVPQARHAIPRR